MKVYTIQLATALLLFFLTGCESRAQNKVLAEKDGYQLTQTLINGMLAFAEENESPLNDAEKEAYTQDYIVEFLANPKAVIKELEDYKSTPQPNPQPNPTPEPKEVKDVKLAAGHLKVRQVLGNDIGKMQFDSEEANKFRNYLANSLLSSGSNSYDGIGFRSSNAHIQICKNGTFTQALSAQIAVDGEGIDASTDSTDYMPGYWEVASLPNNMLVILFYSTHPLMLEDSSNGFLPFPVAQYTANFVALPNGDGYKRTANQYCN